VADLSDVWINGTQFGVGQSNKVTSGNLDRWITGLDLGDAPLTTFGHPLVGGGTADTGQVYATPRVISATLVLEWNSTNPERNLRENLETYADTMGAGGAAVQFRVDRLDSSAATISRVVDCKLRSYPQAQLPAWRHLSTSYGRLQVPISFVTVGTPLWADRTATTSDTVSLDTSSQAWGAINNTGYAACGVKIVLSSLVGTWTKVTFVNTTTSQTLIWDDTGFSNADNFDFFVGADATTGWWSVSWNAGSPNTSGLGPLSLARGNNSGTCIGVGGTSGTVTIHYRRLWLTV